MTDLAASNQKKRYRRMFPFQLNVNKPEEREIADIIGFLKQERTFSRTVREGIRLVWYLRQGRLDVLRELFPWVLEQQDAAEIGPIVPPAADTEDMLQRHFQRLEKLLAERGEAATLPVLRPMHGAQQNDDEIELDVKQATSSEDNKPSWNLMIASSLQIYGHCNDLPRDLIEYGLRTGRIPPGKAAPPPPKSPKALGGPKKLAGAEMSFAPPPDIDEDLDLLV
jgi:hypothetical protein